MAGRHPRRPRRPPKGRASLSSVADNVTKTGRTAGFAPFLCVNGRLFWTLRCRAQARFANARLAQAEIEKGPHRCEPSHLSGAGNRSRTCDLRITNALLYQLSYTGLSLDSRKCVGKSMRLGCFYEPAHGVTGTPQRSTNSGMWARPRFSRNASRARGERARIRSSGKPASVTSRWQWSKSPRLKATWESEPKVR